MGGCARVAAVSEPFYRYLVVLSIGWLVAPSKMEKAGPLMEIVGLWTGSTITDAARIIAQSSGDSAWLTRHLG